MLFYSDQSHARLSYMLDLISNEIFNETFVLTSDKDSFRSFSGPKLNYSSGKISDNEFFIHPHGILFESDIRQQQVSISDI